jgi:hypothetical protein
MAAMTGLSKSTIGRIWRTFERSQPHRSDGFTLSTDPLSVETEILDSLHKYIAWISGAGHQ